MRAMMIIPKIAFMLLAVMLSAVMAEVPRPQPVSRYTELWTKSRITTKPEPVQVEEEDVFEGYVLLSVTPLGDDFMVSIKNTKDATEGRIRIFPGQENGKGFTVKNVEQSADYLATKVTLFREGKTGVVEYDEKHLALKKPPAAAAAQKGNNRNQKANTRPANSSNSNRNPPNPATSNNNSNQNLPPGLQSALKNNNNNATTNQSTNSKTRKPRVRRVPTPPSR